MVLIDGKQVANDLRQELRACVARDLATTGKVPGLVVIVVGDDPSSLLYVRNKAKTCKEIGMNSRLVELPAATSRTTILDCIDELNRDPEVHGILVQLPLPGHLDETEITEAIDPKKDVDGLHPENIGNLLLGHYDRCLVSCTPAGIMELLARYEVATAGRHCVVVGRSNLVGKPVANLLLQKRKNADCTVTVCHTGTRDLPAITRQADILIAAIGRPGFITADMVKPGAVVIDVGNTRIADPAAKSGHRFAGDVDFERVAPLTTAITPVPGGVGPMTIAMLLKNTLLAFRRANRL